MNPIIENRRSVRKYKADMPVTKEQLKQLIHAAMLAPSACNTRPWEFIAITNREMLDKIADAHPHAKMLHTATAAIIIVAIPQDEALPKGFFPQDCGAATQNILLEAVSMGLATCWCGVYPKDDNVAFLRKCFNIDEPKIPMNIIAIGYADADPKQRGFFEEEKVVFFE